MLAASARVRNVSASESSTRERSTRRAFTLGAPAVSLTVARQKKLELGSIVQRHHCLVGACLASAIAAALLRCRMSRSSWLVGELSSAMMRRSGPGASRRLARWTMACRPSSRRMSEGSAMAGRLKPRRGARPCRALNESALARSWAAARRVSMPYSVPFGCTELHRISAGCTAGTRRHFMS